MRHCLGDLCDAAAKRVLRFELTKLFALTLQGLDDQGQWDHARSETDEIVLDEGGEGKQVLGLGERPLQQD